MDSLSHIVYALAVINILGMLLGFVQSERRGRVIAEVLNRLNALENRLTRMETLRESAPSHADMNEVNEKLSAIVTDVATINERWKVNVRQLDTIQQHLLSEEK